MRRAVVLLAALALAGGCATFHADLEDVPDELLPEYASELYANTGRVWRVEYFDTLVTATATLQTPGFLRARALQQAAFRAEDPAAAEAWLAAFRDANPGPTVMLFLEARRDWQDIEAAVPIWRVALVAGETELEPVAITELDELDPTNRGLFPYVHDFGRLYLVGFAADVDVEQVQALKVAGAPAQVEVRFR